MAEVAILSLTINLGSHGRPEPSKSGPRFQAQAVSPAARNKSCLT